MLVQGILLHAAAALGVPIGRIAGGTLAAVAALGILGSGVDRIATEIRHLQRTDVREVEEPFASGQKGSSAMPHKRNPVGCENLSGLARLLRSFVQAALENVPLWHERDISHSSVERVILPDATILADYMLHRLTGIVDGLLVYPDAMRANLEKTRGLVFSQSVLLALTRAGMAREEAYAAVQRNAMKVWEGGPGFRERLAADPEVRARLSERALAEAGYVVPHWPKPWGVEADPIDQLIIDDELARAGISRPGNHIGIGWAAPTIFLAGTPEQHQRYLPKIFSGEEIWCQLFSEPGSGSDFAGLSSTGVKDGDEWIVNGQKVWTTLAHLSKWGLLVVRTDPNAVKHAGLTAFVVDMQDPTVEIRPLRQMTGEAEFNEVFFSDTRIPAAEMLGSPGDG